MIKPTGTPIDSLTFSILSITSKDFMTDKPFQAELFFQPMVHDCPEFETAESNYYSYMFKDARTSFASLWRDYDSLAHRLELALERMRGRRWDGSFLSEPVKGNTGEPKSQWSRFNDYDEDLLIDPLWAIAVEHGVAYYLFTDGVTVDVEPFLNENGMYISTPFGVVFLNAVLRGIKNDLNPNMIPEQDVRLYQNQALIAAQKVAARLNNKHYLLTGTYVRNKKVIPVSRVIYSEKHLEMALQSMTGFLPNMVGLRLKALKEQEDFLNSPMRMERERMNSLSFGLTSRQTEVLNLVRDMSEDEALALLLKVRKK